MFINIFLHEKEYTELIKVNPYTYNKLSQKTVLLISNKDGQEERL